MVEKFFFWADERPGGGYHEHDDVTDLPNNTNYYYFDIFYAGSGNHGVLIGPPSGRSTGWTSPLANQISTGNETNGGASSAYGLSSELGYYTTTSALHIGWTWSGGSTYTVRIPSNRGTDSMIAANSWYSYGTQTTSC